MTQPGASDERATPPLVQIKRGFLWPFTLREVLLDSDFMIALGTALGLLIVVYTSSILSSSGVAGFQVALSNANQQLLSLSTFLSIGLLGVVLAAITILVAFADPQLYAEMYSMNVAEFHRYIAVVFFPAKLAMLNVVLITFVFSSDRLWSASTLGEGLVFVLLVLILVWMVSSLYEAVHQIRASVVTRSWLWAKMGGTRTR